MFGKLLIANRGEIACRVIRTARRMGIRTVAVFSEADAKALHVEMADEALAIGPPPARESYLRIDRIIEAARRTGAEAIHPGYGFLSENPLFAEACAEAGIVFVGPTAAAMRAMGSKADAKRLMQEAGVPLVPGYHGEDQSDLLLASEAAKIGYPVLIKASAGGGGRGMRAVERAEDFASALSAARREAEAAFGDGRVLIEKYLQRPRHIEVQVLADTHGTTLHLGTRDCSIQRRHQKIVEEAPAPGLSDATREAMHQAAISAARACGYVNAGTIEFIAEGDGADPAFYFMEMNTRLQVEHPVTEAVYGVDLVEQQLRVAANQALELTQDALRPQGHAIELRLCAEDPQQDFRPSTGRIICDLLPQDHFPGIRVDRGIQNGDMVSQHYDSLVAKIIASAHTRDAARANLVGYLDAITFTAPASNLTLLRRVVAHPAFAAAVLDTKFLARHHEILFPGASPPPPKAWAAAAFSQAAAMLPRARPRPGPPGWQDDDPWHALQGFRLQGSGRIVVTLRAAGQEQRMVVRTDADHWTIDRAGSAPIVLAGRPPYDVAAFEMDGVRTQARVNWIDDELQVRLAGEQTIHGFTALDPYAPPGADAGSAERITAPIPGTVLRVDVAAGDVVARGQVLVVMEAMKTELRLTAPADGTVGHVFVQPGDMVEEGMELVQMSHDEQPEA